MECTWALTLKCGGGVDPRCRLLTTGEAVCGLTKRGCDAAVQPGSSNNHRFRTSQKSGRGRPASVRWSSTDVSGANCVPSTAGTRNWQSPGLPVCRSIGSAAWRIPGVRWASPVAGHRTVWQPSLDDSLTARSPAAATALGMAGDFASGRPAIRDESICRRALRSVCALRTRIAGSSRAAVSTPP